MNKQLMRMDAPQYPLRSPPVGKLLPTRSPPVGKFLPTRSPPVGKILSTISPPVGKVSRPPPLQMIHGQSLLDIMEEGEEHALNRVQKRLRTIPEG